MISGHGTEKLLSMGFKILRLDIISLQMERCHLDYNLFSSLINGSSVGKLSDVHFKNSSAKSYL